MKTTSLTPLLFRAAYLLPLLAIATNGNAQSFFAVPDMSDTYSISDDGKVIIGQSNFSYAAWSETTGKFSLGPFPGEGRIPRDHVSDLSNDGAVIVGTAISGTGASGHREQAFRWTESTGKVGLGFLPNHNQSEALAVSANGGVIVGTSYSRGLSLPSEYQAYRWTAKTGITGLGSIGNWNQYSRATDVSADGSVIVGYTGDQAFRWTEQTGMQGLGFITDGLKVSANGEVIVGASREPFRWTAETGRIELGNPELTANDVFIQEVNADGTLILGSSSYGLDSYPFIWSPTSGLRYLFPVLEDVYGFADELEGWGNLYAADMSADGRFFAGGGTNPLGQSQAWIIDLGENFGPIPPGTDTPPRPISRQYPSHRRTG